MKKFLITRPNHDVQTSYLYDFSEGLTRTIKNTRNDIEVIDLNGKKATRANFQSSL